MSNDSERLKRVEGYYTVVKIYAVVIIFCSILKLFGV